MALSYQLPAFPMPHAPFLIPSRLLTVINLPLSLFLSVVAARPRQRIVGQHVGPATCLVMPAPRRLYGHCGRPHHTPHAQGNAEWQDATGAGELQSLPQPQQQLLLLLLRLTPLI